MSDTEEIAIISFTSLKGVAEHIQEQLEARELPDTTVVVDLVVPSVKLFSTVGARALRTECIIKTLDTITFVPEEGISIDFTVDKKTFDSADISFFMDALLAIIFY